MNAASPPQRTLSPVKVWRHGSRGEKVAIFGTWALLVAASVALGLATVIGRWSGVPVDFGGVVAYVTIYPPLPICMLLTLTCGWRWGAIPAWLATLSLALYAAMPWPWALVFACANPLGLAIMTMGYRAIAMRRDLRDLGALLFYLQLSFVASVFSSSGALIWCYTNRIDDTALLPIWQGWWLGAFLQAVLLVGPAMALLWPAVARWQALRPELLDVQRGDPRRSVLRLLGAVSSGVLAYGFVTIQLAGNQLERAVAGHAGAIAQAARVMQETTWVFFGVFALNVLFIVFFGYQLYHHWQASTDRLVDELHRANLSLERLARTDGLTGLLNRRSMDERVRDEWRRAVRMGTGGALVMLDIDHFKHVNDRHGHPAGDAVICSLAQIIQAQARGIDVASRYGGEEFVILLPLTDDDGAWRFAERLREEVARTLTHHAGHELCVTISLGVAAFDPLDPSFDAWLARADQALYCAKEEGRNRVASLLRGALPAGVDLIR